MMPIRHPGPGTDVERTISFAAIVVVVLVVALPALRGDLIAYLDNPVHLAEIRELAQPQNHGWTDLGFCGFPLDTLQSPLTFRGLATLTRLGLPLEALYTAITLIGLAAPALAFLYVARKRVETPWAFALASTLVLYRGSLVGSAAPLGGMFGFHMAAAALVVAVDIFARKDRRLRDIPFLAVLSAFIGLTHMYVTIALVYAALVHLGWSLWYQRGRLRRLVFDLPALALGATTAAAYWMPNILGHTSVKGVPDPFSRVLSRLVTTGAPMPPPGAGHSIARLFSDPVLYIDAVPQIAVVILAIVGVRHLLADDDDAPRYGATIAVVFLVLMGTQRYTNLPLLGPQGDRQIYIVKLGLLAAVLPIVRLAAARGPAGRSALAATFATALGFAVLSERIVAHEAVPQTNGELRALDQLWGWIRSAENEHRGRMYVQDTFGLRVGSRLDQSHVMVRTAEQTGVEQVGAYYGNTPYNRDWLYESSLMNGVDPEDVHVVDRTISLMQLANATHLLLVDPTIFPTFEHDSRFEIRVQRGRFLVLELRNAVSRWAKVVSGAGSVAIQRFAPGRLRLTADPGVVRVSVAESFHPFWRATPNGSVRLEGDANGFLELERADANRNIIDLVYSPPQFPKFISIAGVGAILVLFVLGAFGRHSGQP